MSRKKKVPALHPREAFEQMWHARHDREARSKVMKDGPSWREGAERLEVPIVEILLAKGVLPSGMISLGPIPES